MTYGLGVDLGTSFTAAATGSGGLPGGSSGSGGPSGSGGSGAPDVRARLLVLGPDLAVVPAVVRLGPDGALLAGEPPDLEAGEEPAFVTDVKRRLGDPTKLILGDQPHSAVALLAAMLSAVVATATELEGEPPAHVVLTCPAVWGPYRREQFDEVHRRAGLGAVTIVTEPEAAAVYHQSRARHRPGDLLAVYDLGGGTFDTAVVAITGDGVAGAGAEPGNGVAVRGVPEGLEWVGGIDFDDAVLAWVDRRLDGAVAALNLSDPAGELALRRLRRDCVRAKEALSRSESATIAVLLPGRHTQVTLTRTDYEALIRPALEATVPAVERTLASAGVPAGDLAGLLLAGGAAQTPLVARMLGDHFGRPVLMDPNPKHGVALGAALIAGRIVAAGGAAHAGGAGPQRPGSALPPVAAPPPDLRPPPPRNGHRLLWPAVAAAVLLVLVVLGVVQALRGPAHDTPVADRVPTATPSAALAGPTGAPTASTTTPPSATSSSAPSLARTSAAEPSATKKPSTRPNWPDGSTEWFQVVNVNSTKCLTDLRHSTSPGEAVHQAPCRAADRYQQWQFRPASAAGYYEVVNRGAGPLVWTANGGDLSTDGTTVRMAAYAHAGDQEWKPEPLGSGHYQFVLLGNGKCLNLDVTAEAAQGRLQQWNCAVGGTNQAYGLVPAS